MDGIYTGRLVTDGYGNLLADEGENKGMPVAYHDGSYVFIGPGEPSHNQRHEQEVKDVVGTQDADPDAPGYAGTPENPTEGNEHHWEVLPEDAHFTESNENKTKLIFDPDAVAEKITGHTESYS